MKPPTSRRSILASSITAGISASTAMYIGRMSK
jgi:hypothetical protein